MKLIKSLFAPAALFGALATASLVAVSLGQVPAQASTSSLALRNPVSIAISGSNAFVTNINGNSITEFNAATGALVRVIQGKNYGFNSPWAITVSGSNAFVTNINGNSVTEFNVATGALVKILR